MGSEALRSKVSGPLKRLCTKCTEAVDNTRFVTMPEAPEPGHRRVKRIFSRNFGEMPVNKWIKLQADQELLGCWFR